MRISVRRLPKPQRDLEMTARAIRRCFEVGADCFAYAPRSPRLCLMRQIRQITLRTCTNTKARPPERTPSGRQFGSTRKRRCRAMIIVSTLLRRAGSPRNSSNSFAPRTDLRTAVGSPSDLTIEMMRHVVIPSVGKNCKGGIGFFG